MVAVIANKIENITDRQCGYFGFIGTQKDLLQNSIYYLFVKMQLWSETASIGHSES